MNNAPVGFLCFYHPYCVVTETGCTATDKMTPAEQAEDAAALFEIEDLIDRATDAAKDEYDRPPPE